MNVNDLYKSGSKDGNSSMELKEDDTLDKGDSTIYFVNFALLIFSLGNENDNAAPQNNFFPNFFQKHTGGRWVAGAKIIDWAPKRKIC